MSLQSIDLLRNVLYEYVLSTYGTIYQNKKQVISHHFLYMSVLEANVFINSGWSLNET
jgi:hypothetical protein